MKNMKKQYTTIGLVLTIFLCVGQLSAHKVDGPHTHGDHHHPKVSDLPKLTDKQALTIGAYVLGYQQGRGMHSNGFNENEISKEEFMKGLSAGLKGENSAISELEMRAALAALQKMSQRRSLEKQKAKFAGKIRKNKEFLAANARREGVTTLPSGLQYEVLKKGGGREYVASAGDKPDTSTQFMLHYKGSLINGKEFDSSAKHNPDGKPAVFNLRVVPGFAEALRMMPVGAKWRIFLPSDIAYGADPRGPGGPFSALVFEVELVDIKPPAGRAPGAPAVGHPKPGK